jgi:serine/threonine protein kinase
VTTFYVRHVRPLGQGGLATVDVVEVTSDGGPYPRGTLLARKQLGPRWSRDPGAQQRFEREIEVLSKMSHPNTIQVAGVSLPGVPRFYLMPLYPMSLRALIQQHGRPFPLAWVVDLALKICRTLQYAHTLSFIHRDLKPENILMTADYEPVIADWGLGQFIHKQSKVLDLSSRDGQNVPYYCPAEQWATGRCDASGDVYSLGAILAELVVGYRIPMNPPFSGIRQDVLVANSPQASYFNQTVKRMTSFIAAARHQSMRDVEVALLGCL